MARRNLQRALSNLRSLISTRENLSMSASEQPLVGIIMGSKSDWEAMRAASETLGRFGVPHDSRVMSAHRTPDLVTEYVSGAAGRGMEVIIAAAGGAAHLAG